MMSERRSREAGFTMVEILAALAIMGLMTGVVVLALPDEDRDFRREVRQLAARLEMAAQESIIAGRPLGFLVSSSGYSFLRLEAGAWQSLAGDRTFAPHEWQDQTLVFLERSGFFPQQERDEPEEELSETVPQVRFDPTGVPLRFLIRIERDDSRYAITARGLRVEVTNDRL